MKTSRFFALVAMIMMMSVPANAQRNGRGGRNDRFENHQRGHRPPVGRPMPHRPVVAPPPPPPSYVYHNVRGYEGRIRRCGNHWSYLRDGRWYTYDRYIEPAYFYSCPLDTFGKVVVGTAAVVTLGSLISALVH